MGDGIDGIMNSASDFQQEKPLAFGRQAEIFAWGEGQVVKLFLGNWPDEARREFAISQLAYSQGARTPQPLEVVEKDGRPGIVFEKVEGPSLLRILGMRPWQVRVMAHQFAELHHTVHLCKAPELPSARPELKKIIETRQQLPALVRSALLKVLSQLPDGDSLLHGDFHPDNVMVTSTGMVIIDWPNAARGCPLADVARTTITLRFGEPVGKISIGLLVLSRTLRGIFRAAYVREYFRRSPHPEADLLSWEIILAAQRIGDRIPGEESKLIKFIERNLPNI
jgi:thiamine kinase